MKFIIGLSLYFIIGHAVQAQEPVPVVGYPGYPVQVQQPHDPWGHAKATGNYAPKTERLPMSSPPPVPVVKPLQLQLKPAPRQVRCRTFNNQTVCN